MNELDLQLRLIGSSARLAEFGVNWLVQSALLLSAGLAAGWLLRRRGPAAQSVVYRTTLVAVLVCPLAAGVLDRIGVAGWSVSLGIATAGRGSPVRAEHPPGIGELADGQWRLLPEELDPREFAGASAERSALAPGSELAEAATPGPGRSAPPPAAASSDHDRTVPATVPAFAFQRIAPLAGLVWLLASAVLLARLAGSWRQLARLRRSAGSADAATIRTCREVAALLQVAAPEVKHTPYLSSPCLVGLGRPVVLLPEGTRGAPARDVLLHELAHLRRSDGHWNLVRRMATAVFFFQPLLWKLASRLEMAAEEVCDDYVLQYGSDRQGYAHRLVDIAHLSCASLAAGGVGVVSRRSMLAQRVVRILDTSRSLSTRSSRPLLMLVLLGGLLGIAGAALVGIGPRASAAAGEAGAAVAGGSAVGVATAEKVQPPADVRGRVVSSDGTPVAGVHVALMGEQPQISRGPREGEFQTLAEATTGEQGDFELSVARILSDTDRKPLVIARAPGAGLAWRRLDADARPVDMSLVLPAEQPIHGRLVDSQGQPAAGRRIVTFLVGSADDGIAFFELQEQDFPAAWVQPVTSDEGGRFVLRNIPDGHGVWGVVEGTERSARHAWSINYPVAAEFANPDGRFQGTGRVPSYLPQATNVAPGEEAVLQLAPGRMLEGFVRYEDTGQPAAQAWLRVRPLQPFIGPTLRSDGETDAQGAYRLHLVPADRFDLTVYPSDGAPYLPRRVEPLAWPEGATSQQVDVLLPRGVLVRGKIIEAGTGAAVAGARVEYRPEAANNPHHAEHILTGWEGWRVSGQDGRFEIPVPPGPGWLLVHAPARDFVLRAIGTEELIRGRPGGQRNYAHAIVQLNPDPRSEPIEVAVELQRGVEVDVRLTDPSGEPVDARVITRLIPAPYGRGFTARTSGGRFQLSGLAAGQEYPVYFLNAERQLGASATVTASDQRLEVVLQPCGQATATLIDSAGQRLARHRPRLELVVTPGSVELEGEAMARGELAADAVPAHGLATGPVADEDGRVTFAALIPGAAYRLVGRFANRRVVAREFTVAPGETIRLGEVVVRR